MAQLCQHPGRAGLQAPKALSGHHYPHSVALITWRFFLLLWPAPQTCTQVPLCLPPTWLSVPSNCHLQSLPLLYNLCLCPSPCQPCPKPISPSSCLPLSGFSNLGVDTAKASALGTLLVLPGRTKVDLARGQRQHIQSIDDPVRTEHSPSAWLAIHPVFIASGRPILTAYPSSGLSY